MLKNYSKRLFSLMFGLMLYALGATITIKANIGYAPWDVFHSGLAKIIHLSIGNTSIIVGLIIWAIVLIFGEKFGIGTVLNMIFIGVFMNIFMPIIPKMSPNDFFLDLFVMFIGLFIIPFGTYFYMISGLGSGPRDSLMVVIRKKTNIPIGICRCVVEVSALITGFLLGGMLGLGTAISMIAISFCVQIVFDLLKFDPSTVEHETFKDTYDNIRNNI